jgi:cysteine desulfurase
MQFDCDANATYAPPPEITELFSASLKVLSNPSAMHRAGQLAKATVEEARQKILMSVGARIEDSLIFTSGATEANNALIGLLTSKHQGVVTYATEHPCLIETFTRLASTHGNPVTFLKPKPSGEVDGDEILAAVNERTKLVSCMAANNETGVVSPLHTVVSRIRHSAPHVLVHSDASQLFGKGCLSFRDLDLDLMTISAHKIGGLQGVGALVIKKGIHLEPLIVGGAQEMKLRGGTENVPGIFIFGAIAERVTASLNERCTRMSTARDAFEAIVVERLPGARINCATLSRLPNTSSITVEGVRGDDLVVALDLQKILISTGAACTSGKREPSHVLLGMGFPLADALSTVRFSFRADLSVSDAEYVAQRFCECVERMRQVVLMGKRMEFKKNGTGTESDRNTRGVGI